MPTNRALRPADGASRSSVWSSPASNATTETAGTDHSHFPRPDPDARPGSTTSRRFVFQRLVTDLAARFAITRADAIDRTVSDSLAEIGAALELECLVLWRHDAAGAAFTVTHSCPTGDSPRSRDAWSTASIPFVAA